MIIYNVTINIEDSVHSEWLKWMKDHISQVLATGLFSKALFTKVLVEEEMGGTTYSVQYHAYSKSALVRYYKEYANQLQADGMKRFGNKMLAFRTELELVDEFKVTKD
jgi:hypothetical protein